MRILLFGRNGMGRFQSRNKNKKKKKMNTKSAFSIGDKIKCIRNVSFLHGVDHKVGDIFIITQEDCAYFNYNFQDYELID